MKILSILVILLTFMSCGKEESADTAQRFVDQKPQGYTELHGGATNGVYVSSGFHCIDKAGKKIDLDKQSALKRVLLFTNDEIQMLSYVNTNYAMKQHLEDSEKYSNDSHLIVRSRTYEFNQYIKENSVKDEMVLKVAKHDEGSESYNGSIGDIPSTSLNIPRHFYVSSQMERETLKLESDYKDGETSLILTLKNTELNDELCGDRTHKYSVTYKNVSMEEIMKIGENTESREDLEAKVETANLVDPVL